MQDLETGQDSLKVPDDSVEKLSVSPMGPAEEDEFGDFDDYATAPDNTAELEITQPVLPTSNDLEEARILEFLSTQKLSSRTRTLYNDPLRWAFPIPEALTLSSQESLQSQGLLTQDAVVESRNNAQARKLIYPNTCLNDSEWVGFYKRLASDTVFSEKGARFGWRRSLVRKMFLKSLNVEVRDASFSSRLMFQASKSKVDLPLPVKPVKQSPSMEPTSLQGSTASPHIDDRERDLTEAKKLCEISEGWICILANLTPIRGITEKDTR